MGCAFVLAVLFPHDVNISTIFLTSGHHHQINDTARTNKRSLSVIMFVEATNLYLHLNLTSGNRHQINDTARTNKRSLSVIMFVEATNLYLHLNLTSGNRHQINDTARTNKRSLIA